MDATLVLDGNYLLHRSKGVFLTYNKDVDLSIEKNQINLGKKLGIDILSMIRTFSPNRVIFTRDSKSWRKDIKIENGSYKSNREDDSDFNYDIFFRIADEVTDLLDNNGITRSKIEGAEADDLFYLWSRVFFKRGENCFILTYDTDALQNLRYDPVKKNWVAIYTANKRKERIYVQKGMGDLSIFNHLKIEVEHIDGVAKIWDKIFEGDNTDTIPSVYSRKSGSRTYRLTGEKLNYLRTQFLARYKDLDILKFLTDDLRIEFVRKTIQTLFCTVVDFNTIKKNLIRNISLIYHDISLLPEDIITEFAKHEFYDSYTHVDYKKLFENTKYLK